MLPTRFLLVACLVTLGLAACDEPKKKKIGENCSGDSECVSGLCLQNLCLDPEADEDADNVINRLEQLYGSDPFKADTDDDGIPDDEELTPGRALVDTDNDGTPDILESNSRDADDDCIPDQYDAQNAVPSDDLSPMRDVVCKTEGLCAEQLDELVVTCPTTAICVYDAVVGYAETETHCDGVDENCDGHADEGFPDLDGDSIADCQDPDADGDTISDTIDNCIGLANPDQADAQGDGVGDACVAGKHLVFTTLPDGVDAGTPFQVVVTLADAEGATVTSFHGVVSLTLEGEVGGLVAASAAATDGVATLGAVVGTRAGEWDLHASSGIFDIEETGFTIAPGPASELEVVLGPAAEDAVQAGVSVDATVQAFDAYGNLVTDFDGAVTLTSDDPQADLPAAYTFTPADLGAHVFDDLVFKTVGVHDVTATTAGADGQAIFEVLPGPASAVHFEGAPTSIIAGDAIDLAFVIVDAFDNVASDFAGVVTLTSDDPQAILPAPVTLAATDLGRGHFAGIKLTRPGPTSLSATFDGGIGEVAITVGTGAATGLRLASLPATVTAGAPFAFTVEAIDQSGNVETSYGGAVGLSVDDPGATLPASVTLASGTKLVGNVVFVKAGVRTVEARDAARDLVVDDTLTVVAGPPMTLVLGDLPTSTTAGSPVTVPITVLDAYGNVADYDGPVDLAADDPNVHFSADPVTVTDGVGSVVVTFEDSGSHTLTASAGALTESSSTTVGAGPQVALRVLDLPATTTAGLTHSVRAVAVDTFGNVVTTVSGAATVTSTDAAFTGPPSVTLANGQASFEVGFRTAGVRRVTVTHVTGVGFAETSVAPAAFGRLELLGLPATVIAGEERTVSLRALDLYGNVVDESGTVAISSSDPVYEGPSSVAIVHGENTFVATFGTLGERELVVTRGSVTGRATTTVQAGSVASIAVDGLPATVTAGTPVTLTAHAVDAFGNVVTSFAGVAEVSSSDQNADVPANVTFVDGVATFEATLTSAGEQEVVVFAGGTIVGDIGTTVSAAAAVELVITNLPASVVAGVRQTLTVVALDPYDNVDLSYGSISVAITSDDPAFDGPGSVMMGGGTSTFFATFNTPGPHRVTASRLTLSGFAETSVAPANLAGVSLEGLPATMTAGESATLTLRVLDAQGQTIESYSGAGQVDATDPGAVFVPPQPTFTAGVATVQITVKRAGTTDVHAVVGGFDDTASTVVSAATYADLKLIGLPATTTAGVQHSLQVVAVDAFDNLVASVGGQVDITSTDTAFEGPARVDLANGQVTFVARLKTVGVREIKAKQGAFEDAHTSTVAPAAASILAITGLPASIVAGNAASLTITAQDAFGNTTPSVSGGGSIDAADAAFVPPSLTFAGGVATTSVSFTKVGTKNVTAQVAALSDMEATTVTPAAYADVKLVGMPATTVAGVDFVVQAVAVDRFDNAVTTQTGNVDISSDDPQYIGPASQPYVSGVAQFTAKLRSVGTRHITVTHNTFSDTQASDVTVAPASGLSITGLPANIVAGVTANLTLTAQDAFGNTASAVNGVGSISAPDAIFAPTAPTFSGGVASVTVYFTKVGTKNVQASVQSLSDQESTSVTAAAQADVKLVGMPATTTAGADIGLQAVAVDQFDNTVTSVSGSVAITSDDPLYQGPPSQPYSAGVATFTAKLRTAGTKRITVTQGLFDDFKTTTVTVGSMAAVELGGVPANLVAGNTVTLTITAKDNFGNTVAYGGSGTIGAADANFVPATLSFGNGVAQTQMTITKVGSKQVTATANGFNDVETVVVGAAAYADVKITGLPPTTAPGATLTLHALAVDAFDNVIATQTGNVQILSSDTTFTGPSSAPYSNGDASFTGKLQTAGTQTITARHNGFEDIASTTVTVGSVSSIVLSGLPASMTAGVATNLTVTAKDGFGNTATGFSGSGTIDALDGMFTPTSLTFDAGVANVSVKFEKVGNKTITAAASGFQDVKSTTVGPAAYADIKLLNMPASTVAGADVTLTAVAVDAFDNVIPTQSGTVMITSDDTQYTGLQSGDYSSGQLVFTGKLKTVGTKKIKVSHNGFDDEKSTSVTPAPMGALDLTGLPASVTAGVGVPLTVTARDNFGNQVAYSGAGSIGSPDTTFAPTSLTFSNGQATTTATFTKVGARSVTVSANSFQDVENTNVNAGAYADIKILNMPSSTTAGAEFNLMAVAVDVYDNVVTTRNSGFDIQYDDPQHVGPPNATFVNGSVTFTVKLVTAGTKMVKVLDGIFDDTQTTTVTPAPMFEVQLTGLPASVTAGNGVALTVTARDVFGNQVAYGGSGTIGAADTSFVPSTLTFTGGQATTTATFTKVGARNVTVNANGFQDVESTNVNAGPFVDVKLLNLPASTTAGNDLDLQVVAVDAFDNLVPSESGNVAITSDDTLYQGPANVTLNAGQVSFTCKLKTSGTKKIKATHDTTDDERSTNVTAASIASISVNALPANMTAGVGADLTVTARDLFGNTATSFSGSGSISSAADAVFAPTSLTFTSGSAPVRVTFTKVGNKSVQASASTFNDTKNTVVGAAAYAGIKLTGLPPTVSAGATQNLIAAAVDAYDNLVATQTGTVVVTSTDPQVGTQNVGYSGGLASFSVSLKSAGSRQVKAAHNGFEGTQTANVTPGPLGKFLIDGMESSYAAGDLPTFLLTAADAFGNPVDFDGEGDIDLSDPNGLVSEDPVPFDDGLALIDVLWATAGVRTLAVSFNGVRSEFQTTIVPGPFTGLRLLGLPANITAGDSPSLTALGIDDYGNVVEGNHDIFWSLNYQETNPTPLTLNHGMAFFSPTITLAGEVRVIIEDADKDDVGITQVKAAAASKLRATSLATDVDPGEPFLLKLFATDVYGNVARDWTGTVGASASTGATVNGVHVPTQVIFSNADFGVRNLQVAFETPGLQHIDFTHGQLAGTSFDMFVNGQVNGPAGLKVDIGSTVRPGEPFEATVTLVDQNGVPITAQVDVAFHLDIGFAQPGPTRLYGPVDGVIENDSDHVSMPDLVIPRDGHFSLVATGDFEGQSFTFDVRYAPTVSIDQVFEDHGCTIVSYIVDAGDARVDATPYFWNGSAYQPMTQGPGREPGDGVGNQRMTAGYQTFIWNAQQDLGAVDASLDILVGVKAGDPIALAQATSDPTTIDLALAPRFDAHTTASQPVLDVVSGDFDGDGVVDLLLAESLGASVILDFKLAHVQTSIGIGGDVVPPSLVAGDVNYDGVDEFIILDPNVNQMKIATLALPIQETQYHTVDVCSGLQVTDAAVVDGVDTSRDLLVTCNGGVGRLERYRGSGDSWTRIDDVDLNAGATKVGVADLDLDGVDDAVVGLTSGLAIVPINGDLAVRQQLTSPMVYALAIGDLDRDGARDVVTADLDGAVHLYRGRTVGALPLDGNAVSLAQGLLVLDVLIADLDLDGQVDLALAHEAQNGGFTILGNTGDFHFTTRTIDNVPADPGPLTLRAGTLWFGIRTGRFGHADLVPAPVCSRTAEGFAPTPPNLDNAAFVHSADVDGDFRPDLLSARWDGRLKVALGRGDGGFFATDLGVAGEGAVDARVGDFNGDRKPDLVIHDHEGIVVLINNGFPGFPGYDQVNYVLAGEHAVLSVADLDGDGFDDISFDGHNGFITAAYGSATAYPDGMTLVESDIANPEQLVATNLDDFSDLDWLIVRRGEIDNGNGPETSIELCRMLTFGGVPMTGDASQCGPIAADLPESERSGVFVDRLVVEPATTIFGRAFYRIGAPSFNPRIESRVVHDGSGVGVALQIDLCETSVGGFGLGDFDPTELDEHIYGDLGIACEGGEQPDSLRTIVRAVSDDAVQSARVGFELHDQDDVAVDDFDGNGISDFANGNGAIALVPDSTTGYDMSVKREKQPILDSAIDPSELFVADFTGDGIADIATIALVHNVDTFPTGVFIDVTVSSPFVSASMTDTLRVTLCPGSDCSSNWNVSAAFGDMNGDRRPDLVVATGHDQSSGQVRVFTVKRDCQVDPYTLQFSGLQPLGFLPTAVAFGDLFPDPFGSPDLVIVGESNGSGRIKVVRQSKRAGSGYIPEIYSERSDFVVPTDATFAAIGHYKINYGLGIVVYPTNGDKLYVLDPSTCNAANPACITFNQSFPPFLGSNNSTFTIEGIAPGHLDPESGLDDVIVNAFQIVEGGKRQTTQRAYFDFDEGEWTSQEIGSRFYGSDDPEEPNLGPYLSDFDRDGRVDVIVGAKEGRAWIVYRNDDLTFDVPVMFGGMSNHRGGIAGFGDVDGDGYDDAIIKRAGGEDMWVLNRGLLPFEPE